jgi:hypothetical protein
MATGVGGRTRSLAQSQLSKVIASLRRCQRISGTGLLSASMFPFSISASAIWLEIALAFLSVREWDYCDSNCSLCFGFF